MNSYRDKADVLLKSSQWITDEMNKVSDYIKNGNVDDLTADELIEYVNKCDSLLKRANWEDKQMSEFISKNGT